MPEQQIAQTPPAAAPAAAPDAAPDTAVPAPPDAPLMPAAPAAPAADAAMADGGWFGNDSMMTWIFIGLGILVVILLIVLVVWLWRSRAARKADDGDAPPAAAANDDESRSEIFLSPRAMRRSFRQGLDIYRDYVAGSRNLYLVPWFLTVGEVGAGKSTLLGSLDSNRPPAETLDEETGRAAGCTWWYYDDAVVLDIGGESILRADGTSVPDLAWQRILGLLQRYRGRRPVDGIVLAVPAGDLWGPDRLTPAQVADKARNVYAKLWQAQKVLGLCLPVYLVITKCDVIPGFSAFARALPEARRNDMLGWSSPQAADAAFRPERVDEAIGAISTALDSVRIELFTDQRDIEDADDVYLLPRRLRQMQDPLRQYLATVFRRTAYHESLFLRGIYLVGDPDAVHMDSAAAPVADGMAALPGVPGLTAEPPAEDYNHGLGRRLVFARDLFDRKIFRETGLVRPTPRWSTVHSRRRLLVNGALGALALCAGVWVWLGGGVVADTTSSFEATVRALPDHLERARRDKVGQADGAASAQIVEEMAREITTVSPSWDTAGLPMGWFSNLDRRTVTALSLGYYKVVVQSIRTGLHLRGKQVTQGLVDDGDPGIRPVALSRLSKSVDDITDLEGAVALFNGINGSERLAGLDVLATYTLGATLPPAFLDRAETYGFTVPPDNASLQGVGLQDELRPFKAEVYAAAARLRVLELAQDYFKNLSGDAELSTRLRQISTDVKRLAGEGLRPDAPRAGLERLHADLEFVAARLSSADATWIGLTELSFGPDMQATLDRIAASGLLGPAVRDEIVSQAQLAFNRMSEDGGLPSVDTPIGSLLSRDASARGARLSEPADRLRKALGEWLDMSFMVAGASYDPQKSLALGGPSVWDLDTLDSAVGLAEDYLVFEVERSTMFPEALRGAIRAVSRQSVAGGILNTVAAAQVPYAQGNAVVRRRAENDLRVQVRSFAAAGPTLIQLLQTLDQIQVPLQRDRYYQFITGWSGDLLGRVDELLEQDGLYAPRGGDFSWWDGTPLVPHKVFGLAEPAGLVEYLADMRRRVGILAHDLAEPLVEFLYQPQIQDGGARVRNLEKWAEILVQLDRYENAQPTSTPGMLEQFITETMPTISLATCTEVLGSQRLHVSGGYFSSRLSGLGRMIELRCGELLDERVVNNYQAIRAAFSENLAGVYPFADGPQAIKGPQASLEAVRAFFRVYDGRAEEILPYLIQGRRYGTAGEEAYWFLKDMAKVRTFLTPLLGSGALAGRASYVLEPQFRVNRTEELGGNRIIEWSFDVADRHLDNFGKDTQIKWSVGEPVHVRLRWAKDSSTRPVDVRTGDAVIRSDDRSVTFGATNAWSLVSLIRQHGVRLSSLRDSSARLPHTLGFEIDERQATVNGVEPETAETELVRVFISVAVNGETQEEGKPAVLERLVLPRFPDIAPSLIPGEDVPRVSVPERPAQPVQPAPPEPLAEQYQQPLTAPLRASAPASVAPERAIPTPLVPRTWVTTPTGSTTTIAPAAAGAPMTEAPASDQPLLLLTPDASAGRAE